MTPKPNLVIGLVCAAGTDLAEIKQQLRAQLAVVGYVFEEIKVSSAIAEALDISLPADEYERMRCLMQGGDKIRRYSKEGSGVASLIVTALRASTAEQGGEDASKAFIIDSLKNPKEIEILDQIYGRNFYTISVYSSKKSRKLYLSNKICRSRKRPLDEIHNTLADELISLDQKGKDETGQSVVDTFHRADFFVEADRVSTEINRFIRLVFQDPFITPTQEEYMMYVARATALRSCDLSRQVGAVIADSNGSIVSTGCNEVPYPGGGFYFEGRIGEIDDNRDKEEQHDPNFNEVKKSIVEFIDILKSTDYVESDRDASELAENLLHGDHKEAMEGARFRNLIEFSRVVHAEMHAITQAAMLGRSLKESTLYCTTYPCHLCARHIISSGINSVVYIEPYPKSLTEALYHREISSEANEGGRGKGKVEFRSFRGISPTLYQRVFSYRKRKDAYGAIAKWVPQNAMPVGAGAMSARHEFEAFVANQIAQTLEMIHKDGSGIES